ncbi:MAG: YaiI/YqxD family protein [Tyzzerella sp.]|uniref:UPF0178 protein IAC55_01875 n=1 Tax=Candidatus Fimicola merdigallinarum TaxID=2840819 RepID=A0A9D9DX10_9FIRM|nr:YaiI/YqxD family protein [Candidatus Fimicola merdigallinarum]
MNILVDADACPVKDIIISCGSEFNIPIIMVTDTSHIIDEDGFKVVTVDKSSDSADLFIANLSKKGDVAVTQDYGLATLLVAKGVHTVHQNGFLYTNENIDRMLFERHLSKEQRRNKKRFKGGMRKRTKEDDEKFRKCFFELLKSLSI